LPNLLILAYRPVGRSWAGYAHGSWDPDPHLRTCDGRQCRLSWAVFEKIARATGDPRPSDGGWSIRDRAAASPRLQLRTAQAMFT